MVKRLIILLCLLKIVHTDAQDSSPYFALSDSNFNIGQTFEAQINYFFNGGSKPTNDSYPILDSIADFLISNGNLTLEVGVHTDFRGHQEFNLDLSALRADGVEEYLIDSGIETNRIKSMGYGESEPYVVDSITNAKYPFLPVGQVLDYEFCQSLNDTARLEIVCEINRRTILKIISIDDL